MEHAMALPLAALMERARLQQLVLGRRLDGGRELMVYPMQAGALLGVGVAAGVAHLVDTAGLLRRRAGNLARYSAWLPALFDDGSLYVLRRCPAQPGGDDIADAELLAVQELLDA